MNRRSWLQRPVLALILLACCEPTPPPLPTEISIVSGNEQLGTESHQLVEPLVVRVTAQDGASVSGAAVEFKISQGDGTLSAASVATDDGGEARVNWTLGTVAVNKATATVANVGSVTFSATAMAVALSSVVGTLHVNPADPVLGTIPAEDGEVVQFLGERDPAGKPQRVTAIRKFVLGDPQAADVIIFGINGLPHHIVLRDGSRMLLDYVGDERVRMVVVSRDGVSAATSFLLRASTECEPDPVWWTPQ